jgi:hypothetical protein
MRLQTNADVFKYLFKHGWLVTEIRLKAKCFPTEDRDAIVGALAKIFPDVSVSGDETIEGRAASAEAFGEILKRQRIRDAARAVMRRGVSGNSTTFNLNKQVATVGKVSFSQESHPLGDIEVTMIDDDISALIDKIAPRTSKEGRP